VARGHDVTIVLARPRLDWPVELLRAGGVAGRVAVMGPGLKGFAGGVAAISPRDIGSILARRAVGRLPGALRERLRRLRHGSDAILGAWIGPQAVLRCAALIADLQPAAVLIDTIFRASLLRDRRLAAIPSVLIAHDVFHARHAALAARGYALQPSTLSAGDEAALVALADTIVAIQPDDASALARLAPHRRVVVTGMPVASRPRPELRRRDPERLVFVGSDSIHNVDGLHWFFDHVWPRLLAWRPTLRLDICGTAGQAFAAVPSGVACLGLVNDLAPTLHCAQLGIAPLRAGSGLKIKLLDYFAHGLTVVTTTVGAAGFPVEHPSPLAIADGEAAFAEAIIDALATPAETREARALAYAARFNVETVFNELAAALGL